ncbi:MAG: hypothetical protein WD355_10900 [Balneolaceae bacterium]
MRCLTYILLILLFYPCQAAAQEEVPEPSEFGSIPDSLFHADISHSYPYEILLKESSIRFVDRGGTIVAILDHLVRIRLYSSDPVEQAGAALIGIPFYSLDEMERVTRIEGVTHQPDGEKVWLEPDEIRTTDLNSRYKLREFMMPEASEGSILEYRYQIERRYIEELPDFFFSHRVPTRKTVLTLQNQDYMRFEAVPENIRFDLEYIEERIDTSSIPRVFTYQRPEPVLRQHWIAREVPAVDEENYISSLDDLRGKLRFQISEFGRPRQPLENSWEFVAAQIRRGDNNPFEQSESLDGLREIGRSLAGYLEDPVAVRDSIFRMVNNSMTFNELNGIFAGPETGMVLEGEPADQPTINMVLLAMLHGAGIEAYPIFLSGRNAGRVNRDFPSIYQFNQMLVWQPAGSGGVLMDASFPHSKPGLIPVDSYNREGMILLPEDIEWIEIHPEASRFALNLNLDAAISRGGDLAGEMSAEVRGYPAQQIRQELSAGRTPERIIRDLFFDAYGDLELRQFSITESESDRHSLQVSAAFEIPYYGISFREGLQFRPMIIGYLQQNPFQGAGRSAPVTLDAPEILNLNYTIRLPEDFEIEIVSQDRTTETDGAFLQEHYEVREREVFYQFDVVIERREFAMEEYNQLKNLYDRWVYLSQNEWYIEQMP